MPIQLRVRALPAQPAHQAGLDRTCLASQADAAHLFEPPGLAAGQPHPDVQALFREAEHGRDRTPYGGLQGARRPCRGEPRCGERVGAQAHRQAGHFLHRVHVDLAGQTTGLDFPGQARGALDEPFPVLAAEAVLHQVANLHEPGERPFGPRHGPADALHLGQYGAHRLQTAVAVPAPDRPEGEAVADALGKAARFGTIRQRIPLVAGFREHRRRAREGPQTPVELQTPGQTALRRGACGKAHPGFEEGGLDPGQNLQRKAGQRGGSAADQQGQDPQGQPRTPQGVDQGAAVAPSHGALHGALRGVPRPSASRNAAGSGLPGPDLRLEAAPPEKQAVQGGCQAQGHQKRSGEQKRHGQGQRPKQRPDGPWDEDHGQKHEQGGHRGAQGCRDRLQGPGGDFLGPAGAPAQEVFEHDDAVVHDHADADGHARQGNQVEPDPGQVHGQEDDGHADRDCGGGDQSHADLAKHNEEHPDGGEDAEGDRGQETPQALLDFQARVADDLQSAVPGEARTQLFHPPANAASGVQAPGVTALVEEQPDRLRAVPVKERGPFFDPRADFSQIPKGEKPGGRLPEAPRPQTRRGAEAVDRSDQRDRAQGFEGIHPGARLDAVLQAAFDHRAQGQLVHRHGHGSGHRLQGHPRRLEPGAVDLHAQLRFAQADQAHRGHSGGLAQAGRQLEARHPADVLHAAPRRRDHRQEQHRLVVGVFGEHQGLANPVGQVRVHRVDGFPRLGYRPKGIDPPVEAKGHRRDLVLAHGADLPDALDRGQGILQGQGHQLLDLRRRDAWILGDHPGHRNRQCGQQLPVQAQERYDSQGAHSRVEHQDRDRMLRRSADQGTH